jgi:hypothetical protein
MRGARASWLAGCLALAACASTGELRFDAPAQPLDFGYRGGARREIRIERPFAETRARMECKDEAPAQPRGQRPMRRVRKTEELLACADQPAPWLAAQLAGALQTAGFRVVDGATSNPDALQVKGTLLKLAVQNDYDPLSARAAADVWIQLVVETESGLKATRRFFVRTYFAGEPYLPTVQRALDDALLRAVREMTAATLSLSNRYPPKDTSVAAVPEPTP